jgi:hypothetical protein
MAATVGVAFGSQNDITTEAADAVVLETALAKIDELMHISQRLRRRALSAAWPPAFLGMIAAALGYLPPIWGAVGQELIDLLAVLNAVRVALPTDDLQDFQSMPTKTHLDMSFRTERGICSSPIRSSPSDRLPTLSLSAKPMRPIAWPLCVQIYWSRSTACYNSPRASAPAVAEPVVAVVAVAAESVPAAARYSGWN